VHRLGAAPLVCIPYSTQLRVRDGARAAAPDRFLDGCARLGSEEDENGPKRSEGTFQCDSSYMCKEV